ncbi:MAG: PAS domain S-box protein [Longimicrobiales bacterium]
MPLILSAATAMRVTSAATQEFEPLAERGWYDASTWIRFDRSSGLPDDRVVMIREAPGGHVWAATERGLAWYDGFRWRTMGTEQGLPETTPLDLAVDDTGRVLVLFEDGPFLGDTSGFASLLERFPLGRPVAVEALSGGRLAVLELRRERLGLCLLDDLTREPVWCPGKTFSFVETFVTDPRGETLWIVTSAGLSVWVEGEGWEPRGALEHGVAVSRLAMLDGDGRALVHLKNPTQTRGLWEWPGDGEGELQPVLLRDFEHVLLIAARSDGAVILTLESGQVLLLEGGQQIIVRYTPRELLSAKDLLFRADGDLWVATPHGLYLQRTRHPYWSRTTPGGGTPDDTPLAYLHARDGTLWIGKSLGLDAIAPDGSLQSFTEVDGRELRGITALAEDDRGRILIGSGSGALDAAYRWDGETWDRIGATSGVVMHAIHRIRRDRSGHMWLLGLGPNPMDPEVPEPGAYRLVEGDRADHWGEERGLRSGRVYEFLETPDGAYWFATWSGISRLERGAWRHWGRAEGLRTNRVYTIETTRDGRLWFGHQDSQVGLGWIAADDTVHYVEQPESLTRAEVEQVVTGPRGQLWVATDQGLFRKLGEDWIHLTTTEGLVSDWVQAALPLEDRVIVGTRAQCTTTLHLNAPGTRIPLVEFQDPVREGREALLRWRVFSYWGSQPAEQVMVRQRIDSEPWSAWTTSREANLTDLDYGDHRFEVQVRSILGAVADGAQGVEFVLPSPLHRRTLVVMPIALVAFAALFSIGWLLAKRRKAHGLLSESERNFRQLAENVREAFWLVDWESRQVLYVSPTMEQITGRPSPPLYSDGNAWMEAIHEDDRERVMERFLEDAPHGLYEEEYRIVRPDGEVRWVRSRAFPVHDANGRIYRVAGVREDITLQRQSEEALRNSEERYRSLVETMPDATFIQRDDRFLFANPAALALFGARDVAQLLEHAVSDIVHPDSRGVVLQRIREVLDEGAPVPRVEQRSVRLDGRAVDIEIASSRIEYDGQPAVQSVARDITERKRTEARQALLMRELDHRVKNNLDSVLALSQQTLARTGSLPEFERAFVGRLRAMGSVHEALAASHWEGVLLTDMVRLVTAPHADTQDGRVEIEGGPDMVSAKAAPALCMTLHELVTNAAKYGALSVDGGRLRISWDLDDEYLHLRWVEEGGPSSLPPETEGLGLSLIRGIIEHELLGKVHLAFRPTGFACELWIPAFLVEREQELDATGETVAT